MQLKLTVKTPKNQAEKCVKSMKASILTYKLSQQVVEQQVVSDHEFYWIIEAKDDNDYSAIIKRVALGEVMIKKFYGALFKLVHRANHLADKLGKAGKWAKRWMLKRWAHDYGPVKDDGGIKQYIEEMSDDEITGFLRVDDEVAMKELLAGTLIDVEIVGESESLPAVPI